MAVIDNGPLRGILVATQDNNHPLLLTEVQVGNEPVEAVVFARQQGITGGEILGLNLKGVLS